ncbi:SURF1 family protein [Uliginosibacterium sp. sgz301328]|uniref:SURF1 family protein n=1 Tax=Uliginosibacterium sp. sgz301328 TaxID=3243764 RepID=UPI00359D3C1D
MTWQRTYRGWLLVWTIAGALLFALFVALGTWQIERRAWKLDLIARVDQRVHAAPQPAPAPGEWGGINAEADAYRHVSVRGTFMNERETLVQASTALGPGFWVLTPLRTDDGHYVLINRGYVPDNRRERNTRAATEPAGEQTVTGLLRITEPHGGFLRSNDAAANRWYSRDVAAMAAARDLPAGSVAPYFIDAESGGNADVDRWPVGGLTVVSFHNSHLVYVITWYTLALMVAGAVVYLWRLEGRRKASARRHGQVDDEH